MSSVTMSGKTVKVAGVWDRMQPREQILIVVLVVVFFVMLIGILFALRTRRLGEHEAEIVDLESAIDLVRTQGSAYKKKMIEREQRESEITDQQVSFSNLLAVAEQFSGVSASNDDEPPVQMVSEKLKRREVRFDLRGASLEQMTNFLKSLEVTRGGIVLTQGLQIRSPDSNEDRLNASVEVATWERVADVVDEGVEQ